MKIEIVNGSETICPQDDGWHVVRGERSYDLPKPREITVEVPYRSGTVDFSAIYGNTPKTRCGVTVTFTKVFSSENDALLACRDLCRSLLAVNGGTWKEYRIGHNTPYMTLTGVRCQGASWNDSRTLIGKVTASFTAESWS